MKDNQLKGAAGTVWDNTSEVTSLLGGFGVSVTDNGAGTPVIASTNINVVAVSVNYIPNIASPGIGLVVDGVSLNVGDSFLVAGQQNAAENGVYIYNGASSTTKIINQPQQVYVTGGVTNKGNIYLYNKVNNTYSLCASKDKLEGSQTNFNNVPSSINDHIRFDTYTFSNTTSIKLDTSSSYNTSANTDSVGRITLAPGKTYRLKAWLGDMILSSNSTSPVGFSWYNSDNSNYLGYANLATYGSYRTTVAEAVAYFTPTATTPTRVELRVFAIGNNSISNLFVNCPLRFLIEVM